MSAGYFQVIATVSSRGYEFVAQSTRGISIVSSGKVLNNEFLNGSRYLSTMENPKSFSTGITSNSTRSYEKKSENYNFNFKKSCKLNLLKNSMDQFNTTGRRF